MTQLREGDIKTWSQLSILNPNKVIIAVGEASNPGRLVCNSLEEETCKYVQNVEDSFEIYTVTTKKNKKTEAEVYVVLLEI